MHTADPRTLTHAAPPASDRVELSRSPRYVDAQRVVDQLSDDGFPVERLTIVGEGVKFVERVTGRLTALRALGRGLLTGLLMGLFFGLLYGLFFIQPVVWLSVLLYSMAFGAVLGATFGLLGHLMTGGTRDFSSVGAMAASEFVVLCDPAHADDARRRLGRTDAAPAATPATPAADARIPGGAVPA